MSNVASMLHTRLTETLQVDHPVMLAGMGGVPYHEVLDRMSAERITEGPEYRASRRGG